MYVKNVLDDQANIVSATSGHFSADVALTANFGGGDVKDNDQFTIGGMITGFVLQHGEENDWEVTLGLADFSGRTNNDPGESGPGSLLRRMSSAVWLQVTARLPLVRGMGPSTVPRRLSIMTWTTTRPTSVLSRSPWLESSTPTSRTEPRPVGSVPTRSRPRQADRVLPMGP